MAEDRSAGLAPIANGLELAGRAEEYIDASPVLECLSPASLSVVCFRVNPSGRDIGEEALDEINRKVLARLFWAVSRLVREHVRDMEPPVDLSRYLEQRLVFLLGKHDAGRVLLRGRLEAPEGAGAEERAALLVP